MANLELTLHSMRCQLQKTGTHYPKSPTCLIQFSHANAADKEVRFEWPPILHNTIQYYFIDLRRRNSPLVRLRDYQHNINF